MAAKKKKTDVRAEAATSTVAQKVGAGEIKAQKEHKGGARGKNMEEWRRHDKQGQNPIIKGASNAVKRVAGNAKGKMGMSAAYEKVLKVAEDKRAREATQAKRRAETQAMRKKKR